MNDNGVVKSSSDVWDEFLKQYYHDNIIDLAKQYPEQRSLEVKYEDIDKWNLDIAQELLDKPDHVLAHIQEALRRYDVLGALSLETAHVRISGVPTKTELNGSLVKDIDKLITIRGLVRKASNIQIHTDIAVFKCLRCDHVQRMAQQDDRFIEPFTCENDVCGRKGPFQELLSEAIMESRQIIEAQQPPEEVTGSQTAHGLKVVLKDDLTGTCRCGDRVIIAGILRVQRRATSNGKAASLDIYLLANHITVEDKEYENTEITEEDKNMIKQLARDPDIYSKLIKSLAPSISGYNEIKEAIVFQLFGGITRTMEDGIRLRGCMHVLLVGDPGVAKSQLLRYSANLSPRGIYTIGTGASAAGLTAAAVKDQFQDGRWVLEAGAFVQADKGYVAVDEIEKLQAKDQAGLHEALEQQTVSIAKAGIVTTMNARCSCLAAANPKYGRFDRYEGLAEQIGLSPPLLSRFDLIFIILDEPDPRRDATVAKHIVKARQGAQTEHKPAISRDVFRKYIAYAQREISPVLSADAARVIEKFYLDVRKRRIDSKSPVPITPRSLEALIRLSEASARIRLSNDVSIADVERAIALIEASMRQAMTDPETGEFDDGMISGGMSQSQRGRISTVLSIIKELQKQNSGGASLSKIIECAVKQRMTEEQGVNILNRLKQDGSIIEGSRDYYRIG